MRIFIRESGKKGVSLLLPFAALPPLISIGLSYYSKHVSFLPPKARRQIIASVLRARLRHPRLTLVDVNDAGGDQVKIRW